MSKNAKCNDASARLCTAAETYLRASQALLGASGGVPYFDDAVILPDMQTHEEEATLQQHHIHDAAHFDLALALQEYEATT